jgi:transcriptional regulator
MPGLFFIKDMVIFLKLIIDKMDLKKRFPACDVQYIHLCGAVNEPCDNDCCMVLIGVRDKDGEIYINHKYCDIWMHIDKNGGVQFIDYFCIYATQKEVKDLFFDNYLETKNTNALIAEVRGNCSIDKLRCVVQDPEKLQNLLDVIGYDEMIIDQLIKIAFHLDNNDAFKQIYAHIPWRHYTRESLFDDIKSELHKEDIEMLLKEEMSEEFRRHIEMHLETLNFDPPQFD